MQLLLRMLNEVTMDLTHKASFCIGNGLKHHLWPIIPHLLDSVSEFRTGLMGSYFVMGYLKYLFNLLG